MTINRVQTQRPSSTGVRPTGRKPGEFYVNLADMQFGVINAAGTAQDLGAIRFFSASANYVANDFVVQAGALYVAKGPITAGAFNPAQWTVLGGAGVAFLPLTGGAMTGPIVLPADPVANLEVATKRYVDVHFAGVNKIINGDFAINQRAYVSGAALAAAAYGHDRWKSGAGGCTYTFTVTLPGTTITITSGTLTQVIEAGMIEGGVMTLSWTGTAQARVYQGAPTGAYAASPAMTTLTAGTNTTVEFNAGTLARVKLETGGVATSFQPQSLSKSMLDCQRYYQRWTDTIGGGLVAI